jgi:hypothetical protein
MTKQTIATTIGVGKADRPGCTTSGVGRAVASANFVMEVEADYVGHDPYNGRSTYYIGVVCDVTFSPATFARTNELWREDRRSIIGKKLHIRGVPV